jgi:hypothetical protein
MTRSELAWMNYQRAEHRVDRCKEVGDLAGLAIAQTDAARFFADWLATPTDALEDQFQGSPIAENAPTH